MAEQTNQLRDAIVEFMRLRCDGTLSNQDPANWNLELVTVPVDEDNAVPAFIDALTAHLQDQFNPEATNMAMQLAQARKGLQMIADLPDVRSDECCTVAANTLKMITLLGGPAPTDAPDPAPCDQEIYKNGNVVGWLDGGKLAVQGLVDEANRWAEAKMDWHYAGGRAVVKTLGDPSDALGALKCALPRFL